LEYTTIPRRSFDAGFVHRDEAKGRQRSLPSAITAYDPARDTDDRIGRLAIEAATRIVGAPRQRD
jgi:hypothetical protein